MAVIWPISIINPNEMIALRIDGDNLLEPEHIHEFIEIEYVLSGSGIQIINGVEYKVCKGDMLFFNIGDRHSYYPTDKMEIVNCIFYPALMEKVVMNPETNQSIPSLISFNGNEILEIEQVITAMIAEYDKKEEGYLVTIKSYLDILLVKILRRARQKKTRNNKNMIRVFEYIETHYKEISASDVAFFCSYNPSYFSKMFKDNIGISLTEYINNCRINEAMQLILDTEFPIEEICHLVGYKDKTHFYKLFKKMTGVTPNTLRKSKSPPSL